jgi:hypothetical protein
MSNDSTFTILSTKAPLVEVTGDGPSADIPGGVLISDGAATKVDADLLNAPIRRFRVDASSAVQTSVVVTDSPFGAFLQTRRCVAGRLPWWSFMAAERWPRLRAKLKRHGEWLVALWYLLTDYAQPCTWTNIGEGDSAQTQARGGDIVVVTLVSP